MAREGEASAESRALIGAMINWEGGRTRLGGSLALPFLAFGSAGASPCILGRAGVGQARFLAGFYNRSRS